MPTASIGSSLSKRNKITLTLPPLLTLFVVVVVVPLTLLASLSLSAPSPRSLSTLVRHHLTSWKRTHNMGGQEEAAAMPKGQRVRYDRLSNERNAVSALQFLNAQQPLEWFRLDDGVMGGQSETRHYVNNNNNNNNDGNNNNNNVLHFEGTINTNGGGFASIRCKISEQVAMALANNYKAIQLRIRGDGKTYKFIITDGTGAGPFSGKPSWQFDVPTEQQQDDVVGAEAGGWQDVRIPLDQLLPSYAGGSRAQSTTNNDTGTLVFDASSVREIGLMLSLKRADGSLNPKATYGEGIFPFALAVQSITPVE